MKHLLIAALSLVPLLAGAQNHQFVIKDSASHVVNNYLRMLNIEALPEDSILYLETTITTPGSTDTFLMRRWHARPQMFRVEVWRGDELQDALCTNGAARFRHYDATEKRWTSLRPERFHDKMRGYDFRGPLHEWLYKGTTLRWKGSVDYNGVPLQAVDVSMPNMYERTYFFDPSNGLLALIIENDSLNSDFAPRPETRIEWKIIHEYLPIGESLLPSLESFFRGTTLTILATKPRFLPRDTHIFNRD